MCAVPNMAVFCSSLTSWFPGMLLTYFLNDFEIVPVAPIINGVTFVFTFHMRCISIIRSLFIIIIIIIYLIICRNSRTQPSRILKQLPAAICKGTRDTTELLMWSLNCSNARFEYEIVSEL